MSLQELPKSFTCFLGHYSFIPLAFRQKCVKNDVWDSLEEPAWRSIQVQREPQKLMFADFCEALGSGFSNGGAVLLQGLKAAPELNGTKGTLRRFHTELGRWEVELSDGAGIKRVRSANLRPAGAQGAALYTATIGQPLDVEFKGEPARGQGVGKEFMRLGLQCALEQEVEEGAVRCWDYSSELRTYWFSDSAAAPAAAYRACGALLGHAILMDTLLQPVFPSAIYALLLRSMDSPNVREWTLSDLANVSPSMASGLEELIEYTGPDVADTYPLDWPREAELADLPQEGRAAYVRAYVHWYFSERYAAKAAALAEGFSAVVGRSRMLRRLVTPAQLEQIIRGAEQPMDVAAVRAGATTNGWTEGDAVYLASFWEVIEGVPSPPSATHFPRHARVGRRGGAGTWHCGTRDTAQSLVLLEGRESNPL